MLRRRPQLPGLPGLPHHGPQPGAAAPARLRPARPARSPRPASWRAGCWPPTRRSPSPAPAPTRSWSRRSPPPAASRPVPAATAGTWHGGTGAGYPQRTESPRVQSPSGNPRHLSTRGGVRPQVECACGRTRPPPPPVTAAVPSASRPYGTPRATTVGGREGAVAPTVPPTSGAHLAMPPVLLPRARPRQGPTGPPRGPRAFRGRAARAAAAQVSAVAVLPRRARPPSRCPWRRRAGHSKDVPGCRPRRRSDAPPVGRA
ncbi:hypothetical protein FHS40_000285 [Streptomyces spectabilis]|uniref:Uncharacterized protein n=1 Tax=Streptomyces spectabilis TaxID=68270 RepID=A0A7W8EQ27_STRST|nr:hypothetical protein [Streptomyces spectabilis]